MASPTIVRIRTPQWVNPFARRAVEDRLGGDAPLAGTNWLIEYTPSAHGHEITIEGPNLSIRDHLDITRTALAVLTAVEDGEHFDARR